MVGRKNWLFCDSVKGAESSAIVYSLVETAKANGIEPYGYLLLVLSMLPYLGKSPTHEELENMRLSARVADSAFEKACAMIRPGITEAEVRDVIVGTMAEQGGCNFDCIVASGPNSGYPHYNSFDRVIQEGDCIVLDWGCAINEMMSDLSRTVFVGSISDEQRRIYELVDRAQMTAQNTAREGAYIPDIDKAARDVLDEQGYAHTLVNLSLIHI